MKDHIPVTFVKVYCSNCSISLFVINFLPCLVYRLNLHRYVCVYRTTLYIEFGTVHGFRYYLRVLEHILPQVRGSYCRIPAKCCQSPDERLILIFGLSV
jgi:hypothetical protein